MEAETSDTIHEFWFGTHHDDAVVVAAQSKLWWSKHDDIDKAIRQRFESCLRSASRGELDHWAATPRGRLALILLADQFSRNMYRDSPDAFACDALALGWCKDGLSAGEDRLLRPVERVFFYMPLEHSESMADQEQAVALFRQLRQEVGEGRHLAFAGFLDYALRHRDVIARFGRFPHRNRILGRTSTPEEIAFLKQPGSSF